MAAIYLQHPVHGYKVCSTDVEAKHDREHGWTDWDPNSLKKEEGSVPSFLQVESDLDPDFPGREALIEGGLPMWANLLGKTKEELVTIKGIGDATATKILAILNG
jgi:hypothetical protein